MKDDLAVFEEKGIRRVYDDKTETWYFSVVDIVGVLTDSPYPGKYWRVLKTRLKKEGNQRAKNCSALKLTAQDGKRYITGALTTEKLSSPLRRENRIRILPSPCLVR